MRSLNFHSQASQWQLTGQKKLSEKKDDSTAMAVIAIGLVLVRTCDLQ